MKRLVIVGALLVAAAACDANVGDGEQLPVVSPATSATSAESSPTDCAPGYSPCLPPASDYDCAGGSGDGPKYTGRVTVTGSDPYGLDADNDGLGCEG